MKIDMNKLAKQLLNRALRAYAVALITGQRPNIKRIIDQVVRDKAVELLLSEAEEKELRAKIRV